MIHSKACKIRQNTHIGTGLKHPSLILLSFLQMFCIATDLFICCPSEMTPVRPKLPLHQTQSNQRLLKWIRLFCLSHYRNPAENTKSAFVFTCLKRDLQQNTTQETMSELVLLKFPACAFTPRSEKNKLTSLAYSNYTRTFSKCSHHLHQCTQALVTILGMDHGAEY